MPLFKFMRRVFGRDRSSSREDLGRGVSASSLRGVPQGRQGPGEEAGVDFQLIWGRNRRSHRDGLAAVRSALEEIRQQAAAGTLPPGPLSREVLGFVRGRREGVHRAQNRLLLLGMADLMASHRVPERELLREILTDLYKYSEHIDREVFLFDKHESSDSGGFDEEMRRKRCYMLHNTAGWVVNPELFTAPSHYKVMGRNYYYLELPFRRAGKDTSTHLMAEALYRQVDPDFVLELLRVGIFPSCLYLWPVAVMLDLKFAFNRLSIEETSLEEMNDLSEARMIRYFCRARSNFFVHFIDSDRRDGEESMKNLPPHISYDDTLLLPPSASILLPEERYLSPSSLQHLCRLQIRKSLTDADNLPLGIYKLPLPKLMLRYVDLLLD